MSHPIYRGIEKFILVAAFAVSVTTSTGCMGSLGSSLSISSGSIPSGSTALLKVEGTLSGAGSNWMGSGAICYHMDCLGSSDRDGCANFTTDSPGHFKLDKTLSQDERAPGLCFGQQIWLNLAGQKVPGQIMSSGTESKSQNINGVKSSLFIVTVGAAFDLPVNLAAQSALPPTPIDSTRAALALLEGRGVGANGSPKAATGNHERSDRASDGAAQAAAAHAGQAI